MTDRPLPTLTNSRKALKSSGIFGQGLSEQEARSRFYILDADGLITKARDGLTPVVEPFARLGEGDGESLESVVCRVSLIMKILPLLTVFVTKFYSVYNACNG